MTIKNARVGQEYCESLGVQVTSKLLVEQPLIPHGLSLDLETFVLRGIPTTPGDFEWRVRGEFNGSLVDKVFRLAVIPDPKTLWKDIPSDPQAPFWKRDQQTTLLTGEVLMVGASKRGRSHAHEGRYRDDHFDMTSAGRGGWHVLAVADGAGSAKFSRQGSKIAVEFVIRTLPGRMMSDIDPHLDQILDLYENGVDNNRHAIRTLLYEVLVGVGFEAARAVESEAKHAGLEAGDFSTTLIMAAAKNTPSGWFFVSFSVGDGGAALLDLDAGEVVVMSTPDGGEFAGQTRFLRSSEFADPAKSMERIHFAIRPHFTSLVLMTDGITDPKFPTEVTMADFSQWSEFWGKDLTPAVNLARANAAEIEGELLNWLDFWSDGNHDDRTIAILIP